MDNLPLLRRACATLPPTVTTRFFRADSTGSDERILKGLADPARPDGPPAPIGFTLSADMTPERSKQPRGGRIAHARSLPRDWGVSHAPCSSK